MQSYLQSRDCFGAVFSNMQREQKDMNEMKKQNRGKITHVPIQKLIVEVPG